MAHRRITHVDHIGTGVLTLMAALVAFAPFSIDAVLPALPAAMMSFGAGSASFRLVTSATFIGLGIGQAIGGPLSDRYGRRPPSIYAAIAFAVSATACASAQSLLWLQFASACMGAAASVGIVSARAAVRDLARDDHAAHLLARVWAIGGFAPVFAPLLGGRIYVLGGWRAIYVVLAAYSALLALALIRAFPETNHALADEGYWSLLKRGFGLLGVREFRAYAGAMTGGTVTFIGYVSAASFVFQRLYGWSAGAFSLMYAFNGLVSVLVTRATAQHIRRVGARRMVVLGIRLMACAAVLVMAGGALDSVWVIASGFTALLAAWALVMNNVFALAMSAQSGASGSASAVLGMSAYAAGGLVSALVGMAGGVGGITTGLIMLFGIAIASLSLSTGYARSASLAQ